MVLYKGIQFGNGTQLSGIVNSPDESFPFDKHSFEVKEKNILL